MQRQTNGTNTQPMQFGDFVNPNSMITPGVAGGITMAITNALTSQFNFLPGNWTALLLSFLFGAITFVYAARLMARIAYFVINSLIIFVMAHGSNAIGVAATKSASTAPRTERAASLPKPDVIQGWMPVSFTDGQAAKARVMRPGDLILVQAKIDKDKSKSFFQEWSWSGK
jgi:hypothetical protein